MPKLYSDEFKHDAVALLETGISQPQVSKDLGVSKTALQTWARDARLQSHGMSPSADADERKEMSQALNRIRELEMENEVLRQYFPKGTDLSRWSAEDLEAVALALNNRPRKVLGWKTPAEVFAEQIHSLKTDGVATTG
ncbi:transposase [Glutamicibacter creatinolyticus]|uniref:transposase n=1 Tax=Glutamicibacter creatinolyticus TaxID=162496 RepID=UPI003379B326